MENWIAPRLTDGIGNRLFQMAAAIKVSDDLKRELCIFLPRYTKQGHGNYNLVFQLCPGIPVKESDESWEEREERGENKIIKTDKKGLVLKGYFQNLNYFPDPRHPLLPSLPKEVLKPVQNKVAIHFRFGDYCILPHHQINLQTYYMRAIQKFPGEEFVLLSDSPEKLPAIRDELVKKGYRVSIANQGSVLETLLTIASCVKGFIGGNSTFAWWAAFLSWRALGFSNDFVAYFPDTWMPNLRPNLFSLEYTKSLSTEEKGDKLESFVY